MSSSHAFISWFVAALGDVLAFAGRTSCTILLFVVVNVALDIFRAFIYVGRMVVLLDIMSFFGPTDSSVSARRVLEVYSTKHTYVHSSFFSDCRYMAARNRHGAPRLCCVHRLVLLSRRKLKHRPAQFCQQNCSASRAQKVLVLFWCRPDASSAGPRRFSVNTFTASAPEHVKIRRTWHPALKLLVRVHACSIYSLPQNTRRN